MNRFLVNNTFIKYYSFLKQNVQKIQESELTTTISKQELQLLVKDGYLKEEPYCFCANCGFSCHEKKELCFTCNDSEGLIYDPFYSPNDKFFNELTLFIQNTLESNEWTIREINDEYILASKLKSETKLKIYILKGDLTDYDFYAYYGLNTTNNIYWLLFIASNCSNYLKSLTNDLYQSILIITPADQIIDFFTDPLSIFDKLINIEPNKISLRLAGLSHILNIDVKHSSEILRLALKDQQRTTITDILLSAYQTTPAISYYGSSEKVGIEFDHNFCQIMTLINPNSFSIGGSNNPDIISYFDYRQDKSEIMYISLKTSKKIYDISKADVDEVCPHLYKLMNSRELDDYNIAYLLFIIPEIKEKSTLVYFSTMIQNRLKYKINIYYLTIETTLYYALKFQESLSKIHFNPEMFIDFIGTSNTSKLLTIKDVDNFFFNYPQSRKEYLKSIITTATKKK